MFKMSKQAMKERIEEALKAGSEEEARRRVAVCLWGLDKVRGGTELANALIDEMGLEKWGAKKFEAPVK